MYYTTTSIVESFLLILFVQVKSGNYCERLTFDILLCPGFQTNVTCFVLLNLNGNYNDHENKIKI